MVDRLSLLQPVWEACIPRKDVIEGKMTVSELALSLSSIVSGTAKPPYDKPITFFDSTFPTTNLKIIISDILKRLHGNGADVNPIIVLDVGFGGGKTHTLAALYYAAKFGAPANITETKPDSRIKIISISGEDVDSKGFARDKLRTRTIWGDFFYQLGKYYEYKDYDSPKEFPGKHVIAEAMGDEPVLILLDEITKYLDVASTDQDLLTGTVHFLHNLILAISSKENSAIVLALAEDAFKYEAEKVKGTIKEAVEEAKRDIGALYKRQQIELRPVQEEDAVHILQKRLFEKIPEEKGRSIANAYHELYKNLPIDEKFKKESYRDEIETSYPFHPELIRVFYERIATLEGFQRTRGALRILSAAIKKIWNDKEPDSMLIHPFHIDLSNDFIAEDLTIKLGEPKYRNAIEADIFNKTGHAVAQRIDDQSLSHWGAPLVRRCCNTIYLYSLSAGKADVKGIRQGWLSILLATPATKGYDHFFLVRDTIQNILVEEFHFIERQGERLLFVKEPSIFKTIENHSRDISLDVVMNTIRNKIAELFSGDPEWLSISKIFVDSPSDIPDDNSINVAILNPKSFSLSSIQKSEKVPPEISNFIKYKDNYLNKARSNVNSVFLLVAEHSSIEPLLNAARKLEAVIEVRREPSIFGISNERKQDIERYFSEKQSTLLDLLRTTFSHLVYMERESPTSKFFNPGGYGKGYSGKLVLSNFLKKLNRIIDNPFDPEIVLIKLIPSNTISINFKDLYDKFFRVPELFIPVNKDILVETIKTGIKDRLWIIKTGDKITHSLNLKESIYLGDETELILYEYAEKTNLLRSPTDNITSNLENVTKSNFDNLETYMVEKGYSFEMPEQDLKTIAESLPQKIKNMNKNFKQVNELVILHHHIQPENIVLAKFLLDKLRPDKDCSANIKASIDKYEKSPTYHIEVNILKEDLSTEVGKKTIELIRQFLEPNSIELKIHVEWKNGISPEEAEKLLLDYDSGNNLNAELKTTVSV